MPKKSTTYAERLDWDIAEKLFGVSAIRRVAGGPTSLSNYRRDGVPSHAVVKLLRKHGGAMGALIPRDPFADHPAELAFALKLMIRYYQIVDDPKADHWVAVVAGFVNRMERAHAEVLATLIKERAEWPA